MIKMAIITAYIAHKIWWKRNQRINVIKWEAWGKNEISPNR